MRQWLLHSRNLLRLMKCDGQNFIVAETHNHKWNVKGDGRRNDGVGLIDIQKALPYLHFVVGFPVKAHKYWEKWNAETGSKQFDFFELDFWFFFGWFTCWSRWRKYKSPLFSSSLARSNGADRWWPNIDRRKRHINAGDWRYSSYQKTKLRWRSVKWMWSIIHRVSWQSSAWATNNPVKIQHLTNHWLLIFFSFFILK